MRVKLLFFLLLFVSCKHTAQNVDAIQLYEENLTYIKNAITSNNISPELFNNAVEKIEQITKISSYVDQSDYGNFKIPVSYNIDDWMLWLEQNKKYLDFQKNTSQFIADNATPLKKNPQLLFNLYLNDLNKMEKEENYIVHEIDYILNNLEGITGMKFTYNSICECRFPTSLEFSNINQWLIEHKEKLTWNAEKQKILLIK